MTSSLWPGSLSILRKRGSTGDNSFRRKAHPSKSETRATYCTTAVRLRFENRGGGLVSAAKKTGYGTKNLKQVAAHLLGD